MPRTVSRDPVAQHKLEYRSRNTSVLWQSGTRKCQERYQHKLEYRSRNTCVLWQNGTATPFGIYTIIKKSNQYRSAHRLLNHQPDNIVLGARVPNGKRIPNDSPHHLRQHLRPILRKTNRNQNSCLSESVRHGFWLRFAGWSPTALPCKTRVPITKHLGIVAGRYPQLSGPLPT